MSWRTQGQVPKPTVRRLARARPSATFPRGLSSVIFLGVVWKSSWETPAASPESLSYSTQEEVWALLNSNSYTSSWGLVKMENCARKSSVCSLKTTLTGRLVLHQTDIVAGAL